MLETILKSIICTRSKPEIATTGAHRTLTYLPVSHGSTAGSVSHCSALRTGNQARRRKERVPTPAGGGGGGLNRGFSMEFE